LQDKKTPVKFFDPDVERARRFVGFFKLDAEILAKVFVELWLLLSRFSFKLQSPEPTATTLRTAFPSSS
jgi:hypothetical protein